MRANLIVAVISVAALSLATWVSLGTYTRTETAKGLLSTEAQTQRAVALRPGVLTDLKVTEGDLVERGQPLGIVRVDQDYASDRNATQESLVALSREQDLLVQKIHDTSAGARSQIASLESAIGNSSVEVGYLQQQIAIQHDIVESLRQIYMRVAPLANRGFVSRFELERRRNEFLNGEAAQARLSQQLSSLLSARFKQQAEVKQIKAAQRSEINTARSSHETITVQMAKMSAEGTYVVRAPISGMVTAIQAAPGKTVDQTAPLLTIVPSQSPLYAEIYAPSRAIGFVRAGEEARLLYDAFPYAHFGSFKARIVSVSRTSINPAEMAGPLRFDEPMYRIIAVPERQEIEAYGKKMKLQPGMTLSATLILERHSFWEWLLEPLFAVMRRDR